MMYVSNQSILQKTFFGSMVLKRFVPGNLSNQQLGKMPICLTHCHGCLGRSSRCTVHCQRVRVTMFTHSTTTVSQIFVNHSCFLLTIIKMPSVYSGTCLASVQDKWQLKGCSSFLRIVKPPLLQLFFHPNNRLHVPQHRRKCSIFFQLMQSSVVFPLKARSVRERLLELLHFW